MPTQPSLLPCHPMGNVGFPSASGLSGRFGSKLERRSIRSVKSPCWRGILVKAWRGVHGGAPWSAVMLVFAVIATTVAVAAAIAFWSKAIPALRPRRRSDRFIDRMRAATLQLIADGLALIAAMAAGYALIEFLLPHFDLAHAAASNSLEWLVVVGLYIIFGRFLVSPQAPENRLMPLPHAKRHFRLFVLYGMFGYLITPIVHFISQASDNKMGHSSLLSSAARLSRSTKFGGFGADGGIFRLWYCPLAPIRPIRAWCEGPALRCSRCCLSRSRFF
jgi:hypothetical protein